MPASALIVERDGAVEHLRLNRPQRLNALTAAMVDELYAYFSTLPERTDVRVVLMSGEGRGFCAGMDIFEALEPDGILRMALDSRDAPPEDGDRAGGLEGVVKAIRTAPQPVVALVNGAAAGAGMILALACDVRIASTAAVFKTAFVKLGASGCELGVSYFLPRLVGAGIAGELILTGRAVTAARAVAIGLVSEAVEPDALLAVGRRCAEEMLEASPLGLVRTKETFGRCLELDDLDEVLAIERETQMSFIDPERVQDHIDRLAAFRSAHPKPSKI